MALDDALRAGELLCQHLVHADVQEAINPEGVEQFVFVLGSDVGEALAEAIRGFERKRREGRGMQVRPLAATSARRALSEKDFLGRDPAQPHGDAVQEFRAGAFPHRPLPQHYPAAILQTGDGRNGAGNGNGHDIPDRKDKHDNGMPGFMDGCPSPYFVRQRDLCGKLGHEIVERQPAALPPSPTPSLPDQLLERCAVPAVGPGGDAGKVSIRKQPLQVPPQDALAAFLIGQGNADVPVEAAGPDECGVEPVGMVACAHDDNALAAFRTINAFEQRSNDLGAVLGIVVAELLAIPDCVDLVQEDDRWGVPARLVEGSAHRLQHVAKMAHSLPATDRAEDEVHIAGARQRARKGGLARPGRPAQENAAVDIFPTDVRDQRLWHRIEGVI